MPLKSPLPDVPPTPEINVYHTLWNRPDQQNWPKDFTFHVDAATGERRTHQDIYERSRLAATALGAPISEGGFGINGDDGEIVGIMSQNMSDYVTLVHSLLVIATPFALIPSYSTAFELEHILGLTKLTRLFVNAHLLPVVLPVAKASGIPNDRIYILGGEAQGRQSFDDMIEHAKSRKIPPVPVKPVTKDTLAYLLLSSGTTGLPKAVMITHGNQIFLLQQFAILASMQPPPPAGSPMTPPVHLVALPMHHTYALQGCCFVGFSIPQTFVILPQWNLELALQAIPKYKITSLFLVPSHLHQIVNYPRLKEIDLSSVKSVGSGGASLPSDVSNKLSTAISHGFSLSQGYGMSEITSVAIMQPPQGGPATGMLLPSLEARVVREDGSDADADEVGELYLKGRSVAIGYFGNAEATAETFVDGWLRTGDLFRAKDGLFFFVERVKDTLKVSGAQVSPNEIENALLSEPKKLISDVCVAGVSGGRTSDEKIPRAWIVLSEAGKEIGDQETINVLDKWQQDNLSKYKWLRGGFEVVHKIPKSVTGKVLRRVLQDEYESRAPKNVPRGNL